MRIIFLLVVVFLINTLNAQQCVPNTSVRGMLYPPFKNSTGGTNCYAPGIWTSDTSYTVVSYKMTLSPIDTSVEPTEIDCIGPLLQGQARKLIVDSRKGDTISFTCIKAKNKNGRTFTLQPFNIEF